MYAQFTDRARQVMHLAMMEAQRSRHEYVGTEHILLALIAAPTGVATTLLKNLGIERSRIRRQVEMIVGPGPVAVTEMQLPMTPRAKKVLEYANDEARNLDHNYIGTEHLLLGLVRENEGVAAQVLVNLGFCLAVAREEVFNLLGQRLDNLEVPSTSQSDDLPKNDEPSEEIRHFPVCAQEIVGEFDWQIDIIQEEKEAAVSSQMFDKAVELRDLEAELRRLRDEFISRWPKS